MGSTSLSSERPGVFSNDCSWVSMQCAATFKRCGRQPTNCGSRPTRCGRRPARSERISKCSTGLIVERRPLSPHARLSEWSSAPNACINTSEYHMRHPKTGTFTTHQDMAAEYRAAAAKHDNDATREFTHARDLADQGNVA